MNKHDTDVIRTFIGIRPDQAFLDSLTAQCRSIKPQLADRPLRWLPSDNWHITLRFLGNLTTEQLPTLTEALTQNYHSINRCTLRFSSIDWFPNLKRPVILAALLQPTAPLVKLAESTSQTLSQIGIKPDAKPFRGHISLARSRHKHPAPAANNLHINISSLTLSVNTITLFQSHLSNRGASYSKLALFPLLA